MRNLAQESMTTTKEQRPKEQLLANIEKFFSTEDGRLLKPLKETMVQLVTALDEQNNVVKLAMPPEAAAFSQKPGITVIIKNGLVRDDIGINYDELYFYPENGQTILQMELERVG